MMTRFQWFGEQLREQTETAAAVMLLQAAMTLQGMHKEDLSESNPPPLHDRPSRPGQYPRGRTWNLRDSVDYLPKTVAEVRFNDLSVRVGYRIEAMYGITLAMRGWKWIGTTLEEHRAELEAIIAAIGPQVMSG